ncbi:MAG: class I mannose-6-phosphate isomerase [Phycisphaeraceae bacterium]|nr:class I mannose-6-phosphate isomerase [Phycisphaeraceae bacterium]MBX3367018.1 class I mannose-6-phosphate isomerase [Phycisphaeraceae bacterium]QYK47464.1 MAG: class I mannose-6-phosphate isomerase [Phycisphaeraceae bacterium]
MTQDTTEPIAPYPLVFEPIFKEKVWGGRRLEGLGKNIPPDTLTGESWELADLGATSASGGGGGAARSVIINGPLAGKTISHACAAWEDALFGACKPAPHNAFPLLVKYLDAREHLSVQVHPSPAYCRTHPEAHLKTECWYVLDAEPGSVIFKGVRQGVTPAQFREALSQGEGESVVSLLESVPAIPGECHNLPSGTVHALGAGVLVAEVQTPSDTTFRVYDWAKEYGRKGRELHVDASLACIQFEPARDATRIAEGDRIARHVATGYFDIDEVRIAPGTPFDLAIKDAQPRPQVLMLLNGRGSIRSREGRFHGVPLAHGQTALIPASIAQDALLVAERDSTALRTDVRGV